MSNKTKRWLCCAGVRAIKTVAQTFVATVGTSAVMSAVDWKMVISASILAGIPKSPNFYSPITNEEAAKDVAMQAAAMNPVALNRDSVPADVIAKELEIGREKAREEGKPEAMLDKIAEGRLNKFYKESTLLEQDFIKDAKVSVQQYLKQVSASLTATAFKRVTLNEE